MKRGSHSRGLQLAAGVEKTGGGCVCVCVCSVLVSVDLKAVSAGELCVQAAWRRGVLAQGRDCGWCSPPQNSVFS